MLSDLILSSDFYSPLRDPKHNDTDSQTDQFWSTYQELQTTLSKIDQVDLNIIDHQRGKVQSFQNIRFSTENFFQRH